MYRWVFVLCLGCTTEPVTEAPIRVAQPPPPVVPLGPSRTDVAAELGAVKAVSPRVLGAGWTRVGTLRDERVLKPVCGGDVPHLGLSHDADGSRLHVFDGVKMSVHDILGLTSVKKGRWRIWLAPSGAERPVHQLQVDRMDKNTLRWRGDKEGPAWADGGDWVRDRAAKDLLRVEKLDCQP